MLVRLHAIKVGQIMVSHQKYALLEMDTLSTDGPRITAVSKYRPEHMPTFMPIAAKADLDQEYVKHELNFWDKYAIGRSSFQDCRD